MQNSQTNQVFNFDKSLGPLFIKKTIQDNPIHPLYCTDNSILQSYF